jgi:hypothetical protein
VFTERYALSPYIKQIRFVLKGLLIKYRSLASDIYEPPASKSNVIFIIFLNNLREMHQWRGRAALWSTLIRFILYFCEDIYPSVSLFVCPSVCAPVRLAVHLSTYMSTCLNVLLSTCQRITAVRWNLLLPNWHTALLLVYSCRHCGRPPKAPLKVLGIPP